MVDLTCDVCGRMRGGQLGVISGGRSKARYQVTQGGSGIGDRRKVLGNRRRVRYQVAGRRDMRGQMEGKISGDYRKL